MINVEQYLDAMQVSYTLHEHKAVYTCDDMDELDEGIPGLACKNLLLKDQKSKRFFLFVLPAIKKADLKKVCEIVEEKKVSFANADNLREKMGLEPGSVSPFGLLNDEHAEVQVYIDEEVYHADVVSFHPNRNTASLELTSEMFRKFLNSLRHKINIIKL